MHVSKKTIYAGMFEYNVQLKGALKRKSLRVNTRGHEIRNAFDWSIYQLDCAKLTLERYHRRALEREGRRPLADITLGKDGQHAAWTPARWSATGVWAQEAGGGEKDGAHKN